MLLFYVWSHLLEAGHGLALFLCVPAGQFPRPSRPFCRPLPSRHQTQALSSRQYIIHPARRFLDRLLAQLLSVWPVRWSSLLGTCRTSSLSRDRFLDHLFQLPTATAISHGGVPDHDFSLVTNQLLQSWLCKASRILMRVGILDWFLVILEATGGLSLWQL
jgi:hypothetical protein